MPARTSTQRSARGSPVTTLRCWSSPRCTEPSRCSSWPAASRRTAASSPETSSRMPSCWATAPPYGSASTSTTRRSRRPISAASAAASVVRPEPAGPHTATTRPATVGACGPGGPAGAGPAGPADDGGRPVVGADRVGQGVQLVVGDDDRDADPAGAQPTAVEGRAAGRDRDGAYGVGAQVVDGRAVEPGRLDPHHRDVGLPGRRRGQQVVDVDAALQHDDARVVAEQPERLGLPAPRRRRRSGRRPAPPRSAPADHGQQRGLERGDRREVGRGVVLRDGQHQLPATGPAGEPVVRRSGRRRRSPRAAPGCPARRRPPRHAAGSPTR